MPLTIKLAGTKADVIEHLEARAAALDTSARSMSGNAKADQQGKARGIRDAVEILRQWEEPQPHGQPAVRQYLGGPGGSGSTLAPGAST